MTGTSTQSIQARAVTLEQTALQLVLSFEDQMVLFWNPGSTVTYSHLPWFQLFIERTALVVAFLSSLWRLSEILGNFSASCPAELSVLLLCFTYHLSSWSRQPVGSGDSKGPAGYPGEKLRQLMRRPEGPQPLPGISGPAPLRKKSREGHQKQKVPVGGLNLTIGGMC